SDFREHSFGPAFGVLIKESGLLARSVFILGKDAEVKYAHIVPELTQEPDYDAVMAAAQNL
ncbi:MAG: thiol peroxidase, partial [Candidatus Eremiobacteraeota bacterium]|nr:thiol peroxidase [Candidatus Eremiobacteraeota bacterium]